MGAWEELRAVNDRLEAENQRLRELLCDAIPALGCHARDFSQRALIAACEIAGGDPREWSRHPDVLERVLASVAGVADASVPGSSPAPASGEQTIEEVRHYAGDGEETSGPDHAPAVSGRTASADPADRVVGSERVPGGHLRAGTPRSPEAPLAPSSAASAPASGEQDERSSVSGEGTNG